MDFAELVRARRMTRRFGPEPVPEAAITTLLALGVLAPSAGFSQGRDVVVLRRDADRAAFWETSVEARVAPSRQRWLDGMRTAPVLLLCLSDPARYRDRYARADKADSEPWSAPYWDIDTGMAVMVMLLGAEDLGLAACFFATRTRAEPELRRRFAVPRGHRFVGVIALGHHAESGPPGPVAAPALAGRPARRPLDETAHDGRFGVAWAGARTRPHEA